MERHWIVRVRNSVMTIASICASSIGLAVADGWPQWRGPKRDNKSHETGLLPAWPEKGPPLDWRVDGLGDGIASLAIADGRIFTSTSYGNVEYAVALDVQTGQAMWTTEIGTAVQENLLMRWLSQRTPTVDGTRLYVFTKSGWLVCMDTMSGQIQWRVSYPHEFGTKQGKWGFCDRPLIDGDKLICAPGGTNATLVALDKHSGKRMWVTLLETREAAAYASTIQVETDGLKQYVAFLDKGVVSFAADDGRILWRYDRIANRIANSYTPLVLEDGLLCANGYGSGIARLKLIRSEDSVIFKELFIKTSSFDPFEDRPLLVDGHLFAFLQNGIPACLEIGKGEMLWKKRGSGTGKAAATYADGNIIVRWSDGTVALVNASPADYVEKSNFRLDDPRNGIGSTFPVVAGGRLYLRDNDRLYKYDITQLSRDAIPPEPRFVTLATPRESKRAPLPAGQRAANAIFVPTPMDVVAKIV